MSYVSLRLNSPLRSLFNISQLCKIGLQPGSSSSVSCSFHAFSKLPFTPLQKCPQSSQAEREIPNALFTTQLSPSYSGLLRRHRYSISNASLTTPSDSHRHIAGCFADTAFFVLHTADSFRLDIKMVSFSL